MTTSFAPHGKVYAMNLLAQVLAILGVLVLADQSLAAGSSALPRTNLLVFHSSSGEVKAIQSVEQWRERRAEIIHHMESVMGPFPGKEKRCDLDVQVQEETDCGSYRRQKISYASEPGSRVPAFLLLPKDKKISSFPAVLALHPTDMEFGNRVTVEPLRDHYRAYARDLAERGYVVLAPSYPLMAAYQPDLKALGYKSGTMKAIWDNCRGLDLLQSLPFVNRQKIGAIGHSLGGHNALYTAAFDDRIKIIVSSCGFDSYADYMDGKIKGWTSERYMPALLAYQDNPAAVPFDFHEIIATIAPRPIFINAPLGDTNFKWRSVDAVVMAASQIYRLYVQSDQLQVKHPDCGHDFPPAIRQEAYDFLDRYLRAAAR